MSRRESRDRDSYIDEDVDSLLEAEREEQERAALVELELAKSKPVAFAVRANIAFDGTQANLNAPAPDRVASFAAKDFIHVKQRYDPFWWIGRVIKNNAPLCYVPSPAKLDELRMPSLHMEWANNTNSAADTLNRPNKAGRPISESTGEFYDEDNIEDDVNGPTSPGLASNKGIGGPGGIKKPAGVGGPTTPGPNAIPKKKNFFRKGEQPPYEVVPIMRPIVLIGPALKGYDITDMMQKAIFDFLKRHFENRLVVSRISTDISIAKRVGTLQNIDSKKGAMDKNRGRQISALLEVQQELERIFDLASTMQLVVLDCDTVNHPGQVLKSSLAPIIIYIKIGSVRVLQKLIKTRDKDQKKNAGVQVAAAEKLLLCPPENFDLVIDQNTLEAACEALKTYLENYWSSTHPPVQTLPTSKADKLQFLNQDKQNHFTPQHPPSGPLFGPEGEILSSQVPMHPGRPGVMSMSAFALHAGFSAQEISALAGARSGWPGAYPEASMNLYDQDGIDSQSGPLNGRQPLTAAGRTMINDSSDARAKALMIVQKQQQINNQEQAKQIHLVNAPGLHQVQGGAAFGNEGTDTPIVFQSRSARQAKQREYELERARKEIEAQLTGKKRRNRNFPLKQEAV